MKFRYYKLHALLRERKLSTEGLRRGLGLLPSEIAKIETNRLPDLFTLCAFCAYLRTDIFEIIDTSEAEDEIFYHSGILKSHSYTPKTYVKKEFPL